MPLTSLQLAHMGRLLSEERTRLIGALVQVGEELRRTAQDAAGDLSKAPVHPADIGTDGFERDLDAAEETRLSGQLAEVEFALHRLYHEPERFGQDEQTGEPIPLDRLELIPWARRRVAEEGRPGEDHTP